MADTNVPPAIDGNDEATSLVVTCPKCRRENLFDSPESLSMKTEFSCVSCRGAISLQMFPRMLRESPGETASEIASGSEATCQFYPELKAEVVCDECGCFMSRKASITWGSRQLCMPCLHVLREEKAETEFRSQSKIWDNRAIGLLSLVPLTLFTAPLSLFLLIRHRNAPRGWVPRSSFRWWFALVLSILFLLAWLGVIVIWVAMIVRELQEG